MLKSAPATGKRVCRPESSEQLPMERTIVMSAGSGLPQDEGALKDLATKIHGMMTSLPAMGQDVPTIAMPGPPTHDHVESDAQRQQDKWLAGLAASKAGQTLMDHLSHAEAAPHLTTSSAFEQASCFRRVFIHALHKKPAPFGLPKKLPKYIAIVNFSGERLLMYSENACLVAFLTMGADGLHTATPGVQKILDHAMGSTCSVMLYYSLPFQAGFDSAYWECRTLVRSSDGNVDDAHLVCTSWDKQASKGTPTLLAESQRSDVLDEQEEAFGGNMMACDLDVTIEKIEGIDPGLVFDEQNGKLMKMITMLKNERRKMIADHKQELEDMRAKHDLDVKKTTEIVRLSFEKTAKDEDLLGERIQQAEAEVRMLRECLKGKETELQEFRYEQALKTETDKGAQEELDAKASELQQANDRLSAQLKRADKDKEHALSKQAQAHQRMHDATERKLQSGKNDLSRATLAATDAVERAQKVEHAFETVSNEKVALGAQLVEARKNLHAYRLRLNMSRGRGDKLNLMVQEARMAHVEAEETVMRLTNELSASTASSATIQEAAGAAAHESEELQKERDQLADRVKQLEEQVKQSAVFTPSEEPSEFTSGLSEEMSSAIVRTDPSSFLCGRTMVSAETMTVPTMSKAELELGELQTAHCKLQDTLTEKQKEVDQLKVDVARARQRGGKRQPPPSFLPEAPDAKNGAAVGGDAGANMVVGVPAASSPGGGGHQPPQTHVVTNIMVPPATGNGHNHGHVAGGLDLGHDPQGDPMLENTLQQLQMALRTVADLARMGKSHERAARDAWAKVDAYERMGAMSAPMQQGYGFSAGQQFMYGPPQGHY